MVVLGGVGVLMSEVPLYRVLGGGAFSDRDLQGYLAHKKMSLPQNHHRALGVVLL